MNRIAKFRGFILLAALMVTVGGTAFAQETRTIAPTTLEALLSAPHVTPSTGAMHGDVTLVEYFDYNCPFCRALEPELRRLAASDPGLRVIRKDWPIFGDASVFAAYCSFAAAREGKYEVAHDALITSKRNLHSRADVLSVLGAAGLDIAEIQKDVAQHEKEYADILAHSRQEAQSLGLRGTPGIIVGNELVLGGADYRQLQDIIAGVRQTQSSSRHSRRQ